MTLEQAIRILHPDTYPEDLMDIQHYDGLNGKLATLKAFDDALLLACEVMQKEIKRQKGCERCCTGVYLTNNVSHPQFNFCPMCGNNLNGEKPNIAKLVLETLDEVGIPYEHGKGEFVFNGLSRDDFLNDGKVDGDE